MLIIEFIGDEIYCIVCGLKSNLDGTERIKTNLCSVCYREYHLPCLGYKNINSTKPNYICIKCSDPVQLDKKSKFFEDKSSERQRLMALMRYTLHIHVRILKILQGLHSKAQNFSQ